MERITIVLSLFKGETQAVQEKEKDIYAGIYQEVAEIVGSENMKKLYRKFKGQQIVFSQKLYSKAYVKEYLLMK